MNTEPRFLCIDDHPASRAVLRMLLTGVMGYTDVQIVSCTADIVEWLSRKKLVFDVIFLDLNMGPLSGFSLLEQFRRNELYKDTKIIALTAAATPGEMVRMQQAGFDGLIGKPIDPTQFPTFISKILHGEAIWEPT